MPLSDERLNARVLRKNSVIHQYRETLCMIPAKLDFIHPKYITRLVSRELAFDLLGEHFVAGAHVTGQHLRWLS